MTDAPAKADLDRLTRDQLPEPARQIADILDDWLHRTHGILSSHHHVGLFLDLLAEAGLTVRGPTLTRQCAWPGCTRTYQADTGPAERGWMRLRGLTVLCPDHYPQETR